MHKNLNPGHPGEEIVGRVIHHANLILPWPWNQVEREDLGLRVWVRGEEEGARARAGSGEVEGVGGEEKRE